MIVAGSTGSRGATQLLMQAVARLPQGAVILPGFDFDMPRTVWDSLDEDAMPAEDHPQFRFARLMQALGLGPGDVGPWTDTAPAGAAPQRAGVAGAAPRAGDRPVAGRRPGARRSWTAATGGMTLIEAPSPRAEALAIALRLRQAVEDGHDAPR